MPLPPFEQLRVNASIDGLSEMDLERFGQRAVPEPGSVVREMVRLKNDSRRDVPATIIACSFMDQTGLTDCRLPPRRVRGTCARDRRGIRLRRCQKGVRAPTVPS